MSSNPPLTSWLSDELWMQILSELRKQITKDLKLAFVKDDDTGVLAHLRFHQLQLVCKRFNDIFIQNSAQLSTCLTTQQGVSTDDFPSLLGWVQRSRTSLRTLIADFATPCSKILIAVAMSSASVLDDANFRDTPQYMVSVISNFTALTTCAIQSDEAAFDLATLAALPYLTNLKLESDVSTFVNLERLSHLCRLSLHSAHIECDQDCAFISRLQSLKLHDTWFHGLHKLGLIVCTALTELRCQNSQVTADSESDELSSVTDSGMCIPSSLSSLTLLQKLNPVCRKPKSAQDLNWLPTLGTLQDLKLRFHSDCTLHLDDRRTTLSKLRCLEVDTWGLNSVIHLSVDMQVFTDSQFLSLSARYIEFYKHNILNLCVLSELQQLQSVKFFVGMFGSQPGRYWQNLMRRLRRSCSRTEFHVGYANVMTHVKGPSC